jgi:hypothetical protein
VTILGWKIKAGNSPGAVLAIVWFFLLVLTIFLPSSLAENSKGDQFDSDTDSNENNDDESVATEDNTNCIFSSVCCIYYIVFLHVVVLSVISFYTPLLAAHHLGLRPAHVKLMYVNRSLAVFILFIASYLLLDKVSEKKCLFVVIVSAIVPISITFYFALMWNEAITINAAYLLLISMVIANAESVSFSLACSMLSKITPANSAAFFQSLGFASLNLGVIVGRVLAGAYI